MSTITASFPMGPIQLAVCAAVVVLAAAVSASAARQHLIRASGEVTDAIFWDGFAGLVIILPAIVIPALASPLAGLAVATVGSVAAACAFVAAPRLVSRQESVLEQQREAAAHRKAAAVHRSILARWRRYELEPAYCIDFPGMSDPSQPETAAFIKAMKLAARLQESSDADGYGQAVAGLERALAAAERAAGVNLNAVLSTPHTAQAELEEPNHD